VVGDRKSAHAELFRPAAKFSDPAGAVKQAVFGMDVKMYKISQFYYSDPGGFAT
jgi:hypothetical protein